MSSRLTYLVNLRRSVDTQQPPKKAFIKSTLEDWAYVVGWVVRSTLYFTRRLIMRGLQVRGATYLWIVTIGTLLGAVAWNL